MFAVLASDAPEESALPTVLVVEDEALIRFDVADFLREGGYHVVEAASGEDALAILTSGRRIDLVFTDIQMPGQLDGLALARWCLAHRPQIKVILTSGVARDTELFGDLRVLGPLERKPYDPRLLAQRIRDALAQSDAQP